jgi:tetratricopeptide (TPR) repeat protein
MKFFGWLTIPAILLLLQAPHIAASEDDQESDSLYHYSFQPNPPDERIDYYAPEDFHRGRARALDLRSSVEKNHLKPAHQCVREMDVGCAEHELDFVLRWVPNHPQGLELMSRFAVERGKPKSALPYLDFAIEQYPQYVSSYIIYGIHRYRMEQYSSAVDRFKQALQRNPDSASAHYNIGLTLVKLNRFSEARKHAKRAYELGYPLQGLKKQLKERGAWSEAEATTQ